MYAIIAENDISQWNDKTGVKYHFPNKYKKILISGTEVIYYKGGVKTYFGYAVIGDVYQDDENIKNFYAEITDYLPFTSPVKFKNQLGDYLEEVTKTNHWRDGVRIISKEKFDKILTLANLVIESNTINKPILNEESFHDVEEVEINLSPSSLLSKTKSKDVKTSSANNSIRYSKNSTKIGDQGEKLVKKFLKSTLHKDEFKTLRHHAAENEKYGYDFSYTTLSNQTIYIEVKSTSAALFNNFIITTNELMAAEKYGSLYKIYLLNNVLSKKASLEIIENVAQLLISIEYIKTPMSYKIEKIK